MIALLCCNLFRFLDSSLAMELKKGSAYADPQGSVEEDQGGRHWGPEEDTAALAI